MKRALLLLLGFSAQAFGTGLGSYTELVVSDSATSPRSGVRVIYLGTNGYQLEFKGHALLIDPYFSRVDLLSVAVGSRIQPDISRIADGMRHLTPRVDAILVTHGHFDHLLDAPIIMSKTHTCLIASRSSIDLVRQLPARSVTHSIAGAPDASAFAKRFDTVTAGDVRRIGPWKIRVLAAAHDRLFGKVPFDRHEPRSAGPPQRASDWICGEPLAFLIEINGQCIYIDSGGTSAQLPPNDRVDLAILGMALPDSRARLPAALERLQPRYVLPSHQDNFFLPLSDGFQFGPLTDFTRVQRDCLRASGSRLILLDYFRPWTLPAAVNPKHQIPNNTEPTLNLQMEDSAKPRDLEDRTFRFASSVRTFVKQLPRTVSNAEDVRQLVRASGSVAANWIEADAALSKKDFLMRVKICRKEAKESRFARRVR